MTDLTSHEETSRYQNRRRLKKTGNKRNKQTNKKQKGAELVKYIIAEVKTKPRTIKRSRPKDSKNTCEINTPSVRHWQATGGQVEQQTIRKSVYLRPAEELTYQ